jgi:hypothetical protein
METQTPAPSVTPMVEATAIALPVVRPRPLVTPREPEFEYESNWDGRGGLSSYQGGSSLSSAGGASIGRIGK